MKLQALIFDVDGTLADTEEFHRQAFNASFAAHGLDWNWTPTLYRDLLDVTGGKERMRSFISTLALSAAESERLERLVPTLHADKNRRYAEFVDAGQVRARPGIPQLIAEAQERGIRLAIASTTSPANVEALLPQLFGPGAMTRFGTIATGDAVPRKKPFPDIYELALAQLGCSAEECVAFEDSYFGVRAAKAAGLFTIAMPTAWTAAHDLSSADLLLPSLCEADGLGIEGLAALHDDWATGVARKRIAG
jgi:HAD superfamily hydrolase (TIGR01509 family)